MSEVVTTPRAKVRVKTPAWAEAGSRPQQCHPLTFSTEPEE
jgi:hypothetical protein